MNDIAKVEPRPQLMAGGAVRAIVPQSMDEAYRLAKAVCMANMAPKGLDTPEKAMIAIMHGMEIGLTPMTALQRIAVVNGRPTIWGDAAIGLVRASGLCEYVKESITGTGDKRVAACEVMRRGEPSSITRTFSVDDAKRAGLWAKSGPWSQYPERMLQMRARAFALRDVFADVLGGLYLREEIDDTSAMRDVTPRSSPMVPPPIPDVPEPIADQSVTVDAVSVTSDQPADEIAPAAEPFDADRFIDDAEAQMAAATDIETLVEIWTTQIEPRSGELFPPDYEILSGKYRQHETRLRG